MRLQQKIHVGGTGGAGARSPAIFSEEKLRERRGTVSVRIESLHDSRWSRWDGVSSIAIGIAMAIVIVSVRTTSAISGILSSNRRITAGVSNEVVDGEGTAIGEHQDRRLPESKDQLGKLALQSRKADPRTIMPLPLNRFVNPKCQDHEISRPCHGESRQYTSSLERIDLHTLRGIDVTAAICYLDGVGDRHNTGVRTIRTCLFYCVVAEQPRTCFCLRSQDCNLLARCERQQRRFSC